MKRLGSPRRLRAALPLLAMAVLLTVPSTATASKYVWQDTINITLNVIYPNTAITSLLPQGHPSEFWVQNLTDIEATATADGLVLTPAEGYTLPETITVKIGQQTFLVRTDGAQNPEGITFQPETGLLSIEQFLLDENPGGVTVSAAAVEKIVATEGASSAESTPAADTVPAEGTPPAGEPSIAPVGDAGSQDVGGPAPTVDASSTPSADALPEEKTDLPESSPKEPPSEEETVTSPQSPQMSAESDKSEEHDPPGDSEKMQPIPEFVPASGEDMPQNPTTLTE